MYFADSSNLLLPTMPNQAVSSSCCVHVAVGTRGESVKFKAPAIPVLSDSGVDEERHLRKWGFMNTGSH